MTTHPTSVDCPNCKKPIAWIATNEFRPFCSKRCQLIDFGEWATEGKIIAGESIYPIANDEQDQ